MPLNFFESLFFIYKMEPVMAALVNNRADVKRYLLNEFVYE